MPFRPQHLLLFALLIPSLAVAVDGVDGDGDMDLVHLTNQHTLSGRIVGHTADGGLVLETANGRIGLDEELILRVVPSFRTRIVELDPDDYQGHLELARWARLNQQGEQGLDLLQPFLDDPRLDADGMGLIARLTDEVIGPPSEGAAQALPLYRRYAEMGGQNQDYLARLAQLQRVQDEYDRRLADAEARRAQIAVAEGLEAEDGWKSEQVEYANPLKVAQVVLPGTEKNRGLRLSYGGGDKYKAVAGRSSAPMDLSATPLLGLWVFNPGERAIGIGIAVKCGDQWDYYESVARNVANDGEWHRLTFDLLDASFKCKKDDYARHGFAVEQPDSVRELQIQVHNGKLDGEILVDGISFAARP